MTIPKGSNGCDIFDVTTSGHAGWPHTPPQRDGRRRRESRSSSKEGDHAKRQREIQKKSRNKPTCRCSIIPSTYIPSPVLRVGRPQSFDKSVLKRRMQVGTPRRSDVAATCSLVRFGLRLRVDRSLPVIASCLKIPHPKDEKKKRSYTPCPNLLWLPSLAGTENRDEPRQESDWIKLGTKLGAAGQIQNDHVVSFFRSLSCFTISLLPQRTKELKRNSSHFNPQHHVDAERLTNQDVVPSRVHSRWWRVAREMGELPQTRPSGQECTFWLAPNRNLLVKRCWLAGTCLGPDGGENASNRIVKRPARVAKRPNI